MESPPPKPLSKTRYCLAVASAIIGLIATCVLSYQVLNLAEENRQLRADIDRISDSDEKSDTNQEARMRLLKMSDELIALKGYRDSLQKNMDYYSEENGKLELKIDSFREWLASEAKKDPALKAVAAKIKNALDYDELPVEQP